MNESRSEDQVRPGRRGGPKTTLGKRVSARNALKHGLATSIHSDPLYGDRCIELARVIAGASASDQELAIAGRIAEAQIELQRCSEWELDLLSIPYVYEEPNVYNSIHACRQVWNGEALDARSRAVVAKLMRDPATTPEELAGFRVGEMLRLERYRRRALSRFKTAVRDLDLIRQAGPGG